jgi:hypothetical protein
VARESLQAIRLQEQCRGKNSSRGAATRHRNQPPRSVGDDPVAGAQEGANCEDFDSQADAQDELRNDPSDQDGLDGPPGSSFTGREGAAWEDTD